MHEVTLIDEWFLAKLLKLYEIEKALTGGFDDELYRAAKRAGYPDKAIERISGKKVVHPAKIGYKMVDTCAAEFEAETPYFYASAMRKRGGGVHQEEGSGKSGSSCSAPAPSASAGHRVRLRLRPLRVDFETAGYEVAWSTQPRDRVHRLRYRRPAVL
jgi:hypothetical protein